MKGIESERSKQKHSICERVREKERKDNDTKNEIKKLQK